MFAPRSKSTAPFLQSATQKPLAKFFFSRIENTPPFNEKLEQSQTTVSDFEKRTKRFSRNRRGTIGTGIAASLTFGFLGTILGGAILSANGVVSLTGGALGGALGIIIGIVAGVLERPSKGVYKSGQEEKSNPDTILGHYRMQVMREKSEKETAQYLGLMKTLKDGQILGTAHGGGEVSVIRLPEYRRDGDEILKAEVNPYAPTHNVEWKPYLKRGSDGRLYRAVFNGFDYSWDLVSNEAIWNE